MINGLDSSEDPQNRSYTVIHKRKTKKITQNLSLVFRTAKTSNHSQFSTSPSHGRLPSLSLKKPSTLISLSFISIWFFSLFYFSLLSSLKGWFKISLIFWKWNTWLHSKSPTNQTPNTKHQTSLVLIYTRLPAEQRSRWAEESLSRGSESSRWSVAPRAPSAASLPSSSALVLICSFTFY